MKICAYLVMSRRIFDNFSVRNQGEAAIEQAKEAIPWGKSVVAQEIQAAWAKGSSSADKDRGKSSHAGPPLRDSYVLLVEGQLKDGSAFEGYDCVVLITKGEAVATAYEKKQSGPELIGNRPNPFNPVTQIHFYLPDAANVRIDIYNVLGQRVTRLVDEVKEAGKHIVVWDGSGAASGLYFYRFQTGEYVETKKMLLLK